MYKKIESILSKTFLGALLIGGTALGAAMLANPVATAGSGILPAYFVYTLCWLFSVATGCLFIELSSWLPKGANLTTMAEAFLGKTGKWIVLLLYIFQFYFILIAYVALGGHLVINFICEHIPYIYGILAFTIFFGGFVFKGTKAASRLNAILMLGLILSFFIFVTLAGEHAQLSQANYMGWGYAFMGLPVIFISFSYQGTIPTLYNYLNQDARRSRIAVVFGTLIPFLAYLIWDYLIKGIVPVGGDFGLMAAKRAGDSAIAPLAYFTKDSRIYLLGSIFAFFAITTSFIGVGLAMIDFFADVFKVKAVKWNRFYITLLILVPVISIVAVNPTIFLMALTVAGGFGSALLLGVFPIVLVWMGRRHKTYRLKTRYLIGGNALLLLMFLAVLAELAVSVAVIRR